MPQMPGQLKSTSLSKGGIQKSKYILGYLIIETLAFDFVYVLNLGASR